MTDLQKLGKRSVLRALGRDLDSELCKLLSRAAPNTRGWGPEESRRFALLEDMVSHFCDVVAPLGRARAMIELADSAREAVARLSGEFSILLRIEGEPRVHATRSLLTSLFEVSILSAPSTPSDEIHVVLPALTGAFGEFRVTWPTVKSRGIAPKERAADRARFFALAVALAMKLGGNLSLRPEETLVVRVPTRFDERDWSSSQALDPSVKARATSLPI